MLVQRVFALPDALVGCVAGMHSHPPLAQRPTRPPCLIIAGMKAALLTATNSPVVFGDAEMPLPQPGEICVRIHAAALNHRDVFIQKGQYAGIRTPVVLGADGAGTVQALGEGVFSFAPGDAVLINPGIGFGHNEAAHLPTYSILGTPRNGTFAEYVCVPATQVYSLPPHLSMAQAAALPLAGLTAYRAVFTRAQVQANERVLITGIGGGVAQMALLFALSAGCQVVATSSSPAKAHAAMAAGATAWANYQAPDYEAQLKRHGPFQVVIDGTFGAGFDGILSACAPGARLALYGGTAGKAPEVSAQKIFWKHLSILGTTMGSDADFAAMLAYVSAHGITPIIDRTFPLSEAEAALRYLETGAQAGKVVLEVVADLARPFAST